MFHRIYTQTPSPTTITKKKQMGWSKNKKGSKHLLNKESQHVHSRYKWCGPLSQKRKSKTRWADQSYYSCTLLSLMHYRLMTLFTTLAHSPSLSSHPRLSRISLVRKENETYLQRRLLFCLCVRRSTWTYLSSFPNVHVRYFFLSLAFRPHLNYLASFCALLCLTYPLAQLDYRFFTTL